MQKFPTLSELTVTKSTSTYREEAKRIFLKQRRRTNESREQYYHF